jgi:hypothetical protein
MPRDGHTKRHDEAKDSLPLESEGDSSGGEPTGEAQAAANREVDPPA